ncbi:MAG: enhanced serine sensitivity protein SseB C-terminal domain-containing protein [Gallionellaceae bacterium]|jgi:hypothetical protein|nr:enhanced serine sensitivity protein SseB C-terminal domain-containing protein [Gallionellaceae bacterium]
MNEPDNELERKLMLAAGNPASRPEFYQALMESTIFIIGSTSSGGEGATTIPAGATLSIANWEKKDGTPIIPFFTSLDALQRALREEADYVALPARSFFEMTQGAQLVLNPSSSYGKEFTPDEVRALLETGMNHVSQPRVVQEETRVLLGQPAQYPAEMIAALTELLAKHAAVKAAYLCLMQDPTTGEKPALVIGFDGEGDMTEALKQAGSVAADTAPKGEIVDFVLLRKDDSSISEYMFESVQPFYERSWGAKLQSLPSPGRA